MPSCSNLARIDKQNPATIILAARGFHPPIFLQTNSLVPIPCSHSQNSLNSHWHAIAETNSNFHFPISVYLFVSILSIPISLCLFTNMSLSLYLSLSSSIILCFPSCPSFSLFILVLSIPQSLCLSIPPSLSHVFLVLYQSIRALKFFNRSSNIMWYSNRHIRDKLHWELVLEFISLFGGLRC